TSPIPAQAIGGRASAASRLARRSAAWAAKRLSSRRSPKAGSMSPAMVRSACRRGSTSEAVQRLCSMLPLSMPTWADITCITLSGKWSWRDSIARSAITVATMPTTRRTRNRKKQRAAALPERGAGAFKRVAPNLGDGRNGSIVGMDPSWLERFAGIDRLYGAGTVARLSRARVAVVGLGGVGSWAAEALARTAVGHLDLIDADDLCLSNTSRQLPALAGQYGRNKAQAMAERCRAINPAIEAVPVEAFLTPSNLDTLLD